MDQSEIEATMAKFVVEDTQNLKRMLINKDYYQAVLKQNISLVEKMVEQEYEGRFATFSVRRWRMIVEIKWIFNPKAGEPKQYSVVGQMCSIPFSPEPEPEKMGLRTFCKMKGNGLVRLTLESGVPQLYYFVLTNDAEFERGKDVSYIEVQSFQVSAPLSEEQREILRRTPKLAPRPEDIVKEEFDAELRAQVVLDESLRDGIAKIKGLGLPIEEEISRIENLKDTAASLKAKYGI
jgi:hypothetical protein